MKTNEIYVSNQGAGREEALNETEKYADYQGLDRKERMHIRILAEEMLGMVETIAGNFYAYYWIEDDSEGYQLHLEAKIEMSMTKKDALIDASTSKQKVQRALWANSGMFSGITGWDIKKRSRTRQIIMTI